MTYRSFVRTPRRNERFLSTWFDRGEPRDEARTRARLARLSRKMFMPFRWTGCPPHDGEAWENPNIPSGYTYLAQFVAHDCVNSSLPTAALRLCGPPPRNRRGSVLRLETLYGSGPDGCAHMLSNAARAELRSSKLRLGRMKLGREAPAECPFRDLPRAQAAASSGADSGLDAVLIPDDRNDNNVFVSQTTVLFTLLHNLLVDLVDAEQARKHNRRWPGYYIDLFNAARLICTETYHGLITNDLLRRLLHPLVYRRYVSANPAFVDQRPLDSIPIEFVVALRFGHAMVRPHYRVNDLEDRREQLIDVLLTTSRGRPWRLPLDETWIVQWSRFFSVQGSRPNFSQRIGPTFSTDLISRQVFEEIDETGSVGLAYRDLVSGAAVQPWSVPALIDEIGAAAPDLVAASRLLADRRYREGSLRAWMREESERSGLLEADIEELSRDPPLMVFILFEAAHDAQGERLGILGSILIGDVLFKAMRETHPSRGAGEARAEIDEDMLASIDAVRGRTSAISSMAELAQFLQHEAKLESMPIPFV
jgi:Animal haem peroxidase